MITGLNHINLSVKDLDVSFAFYKDILGFKPRVKWAEGVYFEIGDLWFCLFLDSKTRTAPLPEYTHIAFNVGEEHFENFAERIKASGATIWKENKSEGNSLYFLDPNGHKLELHVGNIETRIMEKKENSGKWKNVEWFV
ncbi:MAG: glutathione transferase [Caedibacter sp. 38-128]|nr:fosfomycin resistance glutathione transferase [Holosporales bacterium]OJX08068.1 MAG: glutathione transferase [Caedibacter sp. 38-128]